MQLIKLALQNVCILMELYLKKDTLSLVRLVGYMRKSSAKKGKHLSLFQKGRPQMIADKENLETVG